MSARLRAYANRLPIVGRLQVDRLRRREWPHRRPLGEDARVGVCFVSYNTAELTAQLLFSLFRVLGREQLAAVVAVDNASTDGSVELLRAFSRAGHIDLIENREQRYLSRAGAEPGDRPARRVA